MGSKYEHPHCQTKSTVSLHGKNSNLTKYKSQIPHQRPIKRISRSLIVNALSVISIPLRSSSPRNVKGRDGSALLHFLRLRVVMSSVSLGIQDHPLGIQDHPPLSFRTWRPEWLWWICYSTCMKYKLFTWSLILEKYYYDKDRLVWSGSIKRFIMKR